MKFSVCLLLVVSVTTSFSAFAKVKVVESVSIAERVAQVQQTEQQQEQYRLNAQFYSQLQNIQEEVLRLRGMLEDQQYEIQQLKQRQHEDYLQIDRRLSGASQPGNTNHVDGTALAVGQGQATTKTDEQTAYQAAYDLIPQRKFAEARQAFEGYIKEYKGSSLEANAYYWLGELHILEGDNGKAKEAFKTILTHFSGHNKYPEALYKTATLNFQLGDKATAKQQLDTLIKQYGDIQANADIIAKARTYLQKNYP